MPMTNRDVFAVSWQGGGGWGDPLERDIAAVEQDVADDLVSAEAALSVYGVVIEYGRADAAASRNTACRCAQSRVGTFETDPAKFCRIKPLAAISEALLVARDERGVHVVTSAGYILATNSTRWRQGAVAVTSDQPPAGHRILLHEQLGRHDLLLPGQRHVAGRRLPRTRRTPGRRRADRSRNTLLRRRPTQAGDPNLRTEDQQTSIMEDTHAHHVKTSACRRLCCRSLR